MEIKYLDLYHCFNATIMPADPVIVKVGVYNVGDLAKARLLYPDATIQAYEADKKNYKDVKEVCASIDVALKNVAVGRAGDVKFYRYKNAGSSSTIPRHLKEDNCELVKESKVKSISMHQVLKNAGGHIDLLVLNCEGGELPIMRTFFKEKVRNSVDQICVSFHDPRTYPSGKREEILNEIGQYYHVFRGREGQPGGVPDWLLIRKV